MIALKKGCVVVPLYRVGIDLGGTNIKVGIIDGRNNILAKESCDTKPERRWSEVASDMVRLSMTLLNELALDINDCCGVGIGCPGTIDASNGRVIYSNNLVDWVDVPLAGFVESRLNLPVRISNDANCAALGECVAGAAKGCKSAVMLTLGTGVGGGVIWDGKIFEGGLGGVELGHTLLRKDGESCTCGRRGCVEAYCSATALIRDAVRAAKANPNSEMNKLCKGDLSRMDGKIPFDSAKNGDSVAQDVIRNYLECLGDAITDMVNVFRPQMVLIGGGVSAQGDVLTQPLNRYVREHAFSNKHLKTPPVRIAALGSDAGLIGAACLV